MNINTVYKLELANNVGCSVEDITGLIGDIKTTLIVIPYCDKIVVETPSKDLIDAIFELYRKRFEEWRVKRLSAL